MRWGGGSVTMRDVWGGEKKRGSRLQGGELLGDGLWSRRGRGWGDSLSAAEGAGGEGARHLPPKGVLRGKEMIGTFDSAGINNRQCATAVLDKIKHQVLKANMVDFKLLKANMVT